MKRDKKEKNEVTTKKNLLTSDVDFKELGHKLGEAAKKATSKETPVTKTSMNLMQITKVSDHIPDMVVYSIFVLVVLLALAYIGIYKPQMAYNELCAQRDALQDEYTAKLVEISEYDAVNEEYKRYSYGYLNEEELLIIQRHEVLDMIDDVLGQCGYVSDLSIAEDQVNITLTVINFDLMADCVTELYQNDMVKTISVKTASDYETTRNATMNIVLVSNDVYQTLIAGESGGAQ